MRNRTIRFKITLWYTILLLLVSLLTIFAVRLASGFVLRNTVREYLVGVVEANSDELAFVEKKDAESDPDNHHLYVAFKEGFLRIDDDFINTMSDVNSAIYTGKGEMLYGENPLAKETDAIPFTESCLWAITRDGIRYNIYDRKINLELPDGDSIWVRGIVSEEATVSELQSITRLTFLILPFLILIAGMLGYLLSGRMLLPLRNMEQTAARISKGSDLQKRLETGKNNDELSRLARVFNGMIERLDHSFETERRFTSDASHELRTPMSVILAQTEYTLEKERTNEEYKEALGVIRRQGKRMNTLINDMLDYTRMDQSAERYPLSDVDLSDIVSEGAEQMKLLRTNGITLDAFVEPDIRISGNKMLLSRLLQNLISNAYRYGRQGGSILVTLEKQVQEDGAKIPVLTVRDNGIGIAEEDREKIFDRFYRSDSSRSIQGTGLGLAMVRRIAELHGAKITLESKVGEGSTFRVFFGEKTNTDL